MKCLNVLLVFLHFKTQLINTYRPMEKLANLLARGSIGERATDLMSVSPNRDFYKKLSRYLELWTPQLNRSLPLVFTSPLKLVAEKRAKRSSYP